MTDSYRALLIEDNPGDVRLVRELVKDQSRVRLELEFAASLAEGMKRLEHDALDVVLVDLGLPDSQGMDTFTRLHERFGHMPTLVLTGNNDVDLALHAVQAGAQDYLLKAELSGAPLLRAIQYAVERKRADEALHASERLYRTIVETTQDGIWMIDAEGSTTFVNARMAEMIGCRPEEMIGRSLFDFMDEQDVIIATAKLDRRRSGLREVHDFKFRRTDGTTVWTLLSTNPLTDELGRYNGALAVATDITDRKHDEEELKRRQAQLAEAQHIARLGSFEVVMDTTGVSWSDELCRVAGVEPPGPATLAEVLALIPDSDRELVEASIRAAERTGSFGPIEHRILRGDGTYRTIRVSMRVTETDGVRRLIGTVLDVTEERAAQRALRESERRFRRLSDADILGIFFCNVDGRIQQANDEFLRMTGCSSDDVEAGRVNWLEMTPPDWLEIDRRVLATLEEKGWVAAYEKEFIRKDGQRVPALVGAALLENDPASAVAYVLDISDRKRAEALQDELANDLKRQVDERTADLRRRSEELEAAWRLLSEANRELEAFTYSVSHDLRAPLRAIDGFSRILLDEENASLSDTARDYLARIRHATERMSRLITDLLSLSRIGRKELQPVDVDLAAIARDVVEDLKASAPGRAVEFVIPETLLGRGDPALLQIVMQNLLGNAWKFTSKHPQASIEVGIEPTDHGPAYFVRDDGAGFDLKYKDALFAPFQRLHASDDFEGTGIGLATVHRVISRHGGSVWAQAEVERGATFYFTLGRT